MGTRPAGWGGRHDGSAPSLQNLRAREKRCYSGARVSLFRRRDENAVGGHEFRIGTSVPSFTLGAGELELWAYQNSHFGKGEKLRTLVGHLHDHNSRDLQSQSGLMQHASA
jgi:hypothetical protein